MHGEMTRSVGLVGCVTVTIALGSCGSGGIAIGVDAGQADAPMATLADGAGGDAVRGDADVLPGQAGCADGHARRRCQRRRRARRRRRRCRPRQMRRWPPGTPVLTVDTSFRWLFRRACSPPARCCRTGTARCWGYNYYGQLGNATTTDSTTPVVVQGLNDASLDLGVGRVSRLRRTGPTARHNAGAATSTAISAMAPWSILPRSRRC